MYSSIVKPLFSLALLFAVATSATAGQLLSYAPETACSGELTLPEKVTEKTEAALIIHGGGWTSMDRHAMDGVATYFTKDLGFAAFNINYRLVSKRNPWPACGDDALAAAEFMFSDGFAKAAGFRPSKIYLVGGSAGGHLALWAGLKLPTEKVAGIISISGIADPEPVRAAHPALARALFDGREPSAAERDSMNVMKLARRGGPRILLTHELQDEVVPIESARGFLRGYRALGNDVGLCEYSRNAYEGLDGHCIWIPGSKPHRLIKKLEREIEYFVKSPAVPEPKPAKCDYDIFALYYPGTEHMPEWDMVRRMFPGRRPTLGWYDEGYPENVDWQIKWAVENGIKGFCVDWYWNEGARRLEHWVQAFYRAKRRGVFKWYMMYANHNQPGAHSTEDQKRVTRYWLDNYFHTPEYHMIDGKPVVCIWDWQRIDDDFIAEAAAKGEKLGRGEGVQRAFAISGEMARAEGLPGIHWQDMWRVHTFDANYAHSKIAQGYTDAIDYGFCHWINTWAPEKMRKGDCPTHFPYDVIVAAISRKWNNMSRQTILPCAVALPTGWDDRARSFRGRAFDIYERTPEKFAEICRAARKFCDETGNRRVIIHPLNEWQEGSYIEPCDEYGFGMYEAVRDAFCVRPAEGWPKNMTPEEAACELHEFPPCVESAKQAWNFDNSTEGWYRQPYGGGEVEWHDGKITFVINRSWGYNVRQCVKPFAAAKYNRFAVRMKITPNKRHGLGGAKELKMKLLWGTKESTIVKDLCTLDEKNSAAAKITPDGEWHEYELDLSKNPRWKGEVDELWFKSCGINHARIEIDWMLFSRVERDSGDPDKLAFGPYELANPGREIRLMLDPDESAEERATVARVAKD